MKNFLIIFFCALSIIVNAQITGGSKIKTNTASGIVTINLDSIAAYDAKFLKDTLIVVSDGQSNCIGQGVPLAPKTYIFSKNVVVWDSVANTFVAPRLGYRPFNTYEHPGANNNALQFCQKYAELHPQTLVKLIQIGKSGQPIDYWLTGAGFTVTNANVVLAIGTRTADVLIWDQGESDVGRASASYYKDYYTLRNKWLSTTWYTTNTKHINVGLYTGAGNAYGGQDVTLKKIGSDSIVTTSYVDVSNLLTYDNLHWNDSSLTVIGRDRILNAFLTTPYNYNLANSNAWSSIGNIGTTAGTNFLGTTDATDFVQKANNTEVLRLASSGNIGIGGVTAPDALVTIGAAVGAVSSALSVSKNYGATQIVSTTGAVNIQAQTSVAQLSAAITGLNVNTTTSHTSGNSISLGIVNTIAQSGVGGSLSLLREYQGSLSVTNGTTTTAEGMYVGNNFSNSASVTNSIGLHIFGSGSTTTSTAPIGYSVGLFVEDEGKSGAGSITNDYGLFMPNIANGSSSNYSIYSGGGTMYHKGNIGINNTTAAYKLDIDAKTASTGNPIRLQGLLAGASTDSIVTSASGVLRTQTAAQIIASGITKTSVTSTFTVPSLGEYLIPFTLTGTTQASIVAATYIATDVTGCSFSIPFLAGDGTGTVKVTNRTASAVTFTSLKVNFAVLSY